MDALRTYLADKTSLLTILLDIQDSILSMAQARPELRDQVLLELAERLKKGSQDAVVQTLTQLTWPEVLPSQERQAPIKQVESSSDSSNEGLATKNVPKSFENHSDIKSEEQLIEELSVSRHGQADEDGS